MTAQKIEKSASSQSSLNFKRLKSYNDSEDILREMIGARKWLSPYWVRKRSWHFGGKNQWRSSWFGQKCWWSQETEFRNPISCSQVIKDWLCQVSESTVHTTSQCILSLSHRSSRKIIVQRNSCRKIAYGKVTKDIVREYVYGSRASFYTLFYLCIL